MGRGEGGKPRTDSAWAPGCLPKLLKLIRFVSLLIGLVAARSGWAEKRAGDGAKEVGWRPSASRVATRGAEKGGEVETISVFRGQCEKPSSLQSTLLGHEAFGQRLVTCLPS